MKFSALVFLIALLCFSCSSSDPETEENLEVVVDQPINEEEPEEETEEETEEEDRWASYKPSSFSVEPYYYPNSEIEYFLNDREELDAELIAGDKLVFNYLEIAGELVDTITGQRLADSQYQINLLFAIDANKTEFKLETADFEAANAKFGWFAGTNPSRGYFDVTNGFIEGTKISETEWEIDLKITWTIPANEGYEDTNQEFELSSNFIPEPQE